MLRCSRTNNIHEKDKNYPTDYNFPVKFLWAACPDSHHTLLHSDGPRRYKSFPSYWRKFDIDSTKSYFCGYILAIKKKSVPLRPQTWNVIKRMKTGWFTHSNSVISNTNATELLLATFTTPYKYSHNQTISYNSAAQTPILVLPLDTLRA